MKLISYLRRGETRVGVVEGDSVLDAGTSLFEPRPSGEPVPLGDLEILAPVPRPGKVVCVGLNYQDHVDESNMETPASPILFPKFANAVVGPGAPIRVPSITREVDYEAELAVVISKTARAVSVEDAFDHVLGYSCLNDVSARDLQFQDGQWMRGKTLDTFAPMGPLMVTADEIPDPQGLGIRCVVNGETLQDSNTKQMIFGVAELIAFITEGITLEPGDVIATGTPPGVGFARKPPIFLKPGDTVAVEVDGIGVLTNPVEARR